jgi:hypothetical protein
MANIDPDWTAPPVGHDWRDENILLATGWLRGFVPAPQMDRRITAARTHLLAYRQAVRDNGFARFDEPADLAAWFVFQAEAYAADRMMWMPEAAALVVPTMTRFGEDFALLNTIEGIDARAHRLMNGEKRQPDAALFELIVALAYRRSGWSRVAFVPEERGGPRSHDLDVERGRSRWAAECKRMMPSSYAANEKVRGTELAKPVHALALERHASLVTEVMYKVELSEVPDDYLVGRVRELLDHPTRTESADDIASVRIRPTTWDLAQRVLAKDDVYYGSSRMIELFSGSYEHDADHSFSAKWRPAPKRPAYAEAVYHASVVSWWSMSGRANLQKARHFRSLLAKAEGQFPGDRPGVLHIGMESPAGGSADGVRHLLNWMNARSFDTETSRLRWVYGHYFVPEVTTRQNESWAMTETVAPYKVGRHGTRWPLPDTLLFTPLSDQHRGVHWDPSATW